MCGIVGVLSRPDRRTPPEIGLLAEKLGRAGDAVRAWGTAETNGDADLSAAVVAAVAVRDDLRGFAGLRTLLEHADRLEPLVDGFGEGVARFEARLDQGVAELGTARVEKLNALLIQAKDVLFQLENDRLGIVEPVRALAGGGTAVDALRVAYDLNVALNALDRLEVRGRDSAGLHVLVRKGAAADTAEHLDDRLAIPHFTHRAVRRIDTGNGPVYSFVYKVAKEVGELGDNVRALRAAISGDTFLHALLQAPGVEAEILAHTRWASVGVISEANAHPLNAEPGVEHEPYVVAALNGDVDNHKELVVENGLTIAPEITTDAKVIPMLMAAACGAGESTVEAFRTSVARFNGSVAIGAASATEPGRMYLALRGSGQALYVGLTGESFVVASEPYGVVEETSKYVRLDGETPANPDDPASRGQIMVLDATHAGTIEGVSRLAYDGTELPLAPSEIKTLEITTRDINRGAHRHFLKKEIAEAPLSFGKTLRGRVAKGENGELRVAFGEESLPSSITKRLESGALSRILVIGQGTAAVAGQGVAEAIREALCGAPISVDALPATELSGFQMRDDMSDTLIVAISQSGTTTDTNRTVDLVRGRGAAVLCIVNRRHSDLTERVDGVIYTSDGRDVEMSVASTKAFYSQIAAGLLLGEALAQACGVGDPDARSRFLSELGELPDVMCEVLATEDAIAKAADATAPPRRHWAIVGNGLNQIAAREIRIKLSELCYKSIACDFTEDKKHIDLSSEPLILVCATGLEGGTAADVAKEVEIYAAHKASPVIICSEDADFGEAGTTLRVPTVNPRLAFILTTMVGHLYGYHAAQAIDRLSHPLAEARRLIEFEVITPAGGDIRTELGPRLKEPFTVYQNGLRAGRYNGTLDADTASRLSLLFRYAMRAIPLEFFGEDFDRVGTPGAAVEELTKALGRAVEELARPIDAIKHQAKTVTVGTSRADEALLAVPIVRKLLDAGVPREMLAYRDLATLKALDGAVSKVLGYTRYAVDGLTNGAKIRVVGKGGIAENLRSRTDGDPKLRGTKNTVAMERKTLVAVGRSDNRPIILVPESRQGICKGIVLLHVEFHDQLPADAIGAVLRGYYNRYALLRDAVAETNAEMWSDDALARLQVLDLLTKPIVLLADQIAAVQA